MGYKVFQSIMVTLLLLCQSVFAGEAPESPLKWMTCFYASGPMGLINNDIMSLERHRLRQDITYLMLFGGSKEPGVGVLQQAGYPNQDILYLQPDGWYPTGYNLHNPPMGESKTMEDFLNISNVLPAEKKCLVIWGHGGGSLVGSPLDEVKNKALDLNGLGEALSKVYVPDIDNPPIDLVIYNSCFMSTLENANVLKGVVVNGQEGILCYRIDDDKDGVELIGLTENLSYACYNQENMYPLMPGAVVTTRIIERDEKATLHAYETFTIKGQPTIEDMPLPAKNYKVCINFVSSNHNNAESAFVDLDIK